MVLMTDILYSVNMTLTKVTKERTPRQMRARLLLEALVENQCLVMFCGLCKFKGVSIPVVVQGK